MSRHGFVVDVDGKKDFQVEQLQQADGRGPFCRKTWRGLVRLWVSSVNYTDDVPFSEEMFTRLGGYLSADSQYAPDFVRQPARFCFRACRDGRRKPFTLVDRWILDRLQEVIEECRAAYAAYEFHKVYHTLNQFCAVDLSSLYVDITKDRMYCDAVDSPRRRATQAAMRQIFEALCQLLAPILVFTAEEAWGYLGGKDSVHLELFPESQAEPAE